MLIDMDKGTLIFYRNGRRLGKAFDGLPPVLYPAASAFHKGAVVTLICKAPGASVLKKIRSCEASYLTADEASHMRMSYPMYVISTVYNCSMY
jgi:hypothetical protein